MFGYNTQSSGLAMELTGNHLKAARALVGLDQERLSELSGVSINTVRNMEASGDQPIGGYASTRDKVQAALEALGIEFTNGGAPGVRLVKRKPTQSLRPSRRHK
jgi:transcriptional regulator with XRE-family HTH domain